MALSVCEDLQLNKVVVDAKVLFITISIVCSWPKPKELPAGPLI